jgi:hypothetical protein
MKHHTNLKEKITEMRMAGVNGPEICKALDICPSTLSYWTMKLNLPLPPKKAWNKNLVLEQTVRVHESYENQGRLMASKKDPLHFAAVMLYWAEGTKVTMQFTNTNVEMHKIIIAFLRKYFPEKTIKVSLNYYKTGPISYENIQDYWIKALDLRREDFMKPTEREKYYSTDTKTLKYPYGILRLCCFSVEVLYHIRGAIDEYKHSLNNGSGGGS